MADFDKVKDKQNVRLTELTAFLNEYASNCIGSLSLKLSDGTNSSQLGVSGCERYKSAKTDLSNFKVREIKAKNLKGYPWPAGWRFTSD